MIAGILAALTALFNALASLPEIFKFFRKPTAEKVEDANKKARDATDDAKKTGRPTWGD